MNFARSVRLHQTRFFGGFVLLTASALGLPSFVTSQWTGPGNYLVLDIALGTIGCALALRSVGPLVRASVYGAAWQERLRKRIHEFEHIALPRRIFFLLLAVAEADGRTSAEEREMVRRFLQERFNTTILTQDLMAWEIQALRNPDIATLAAQVARGLDEAERDTLFFWSCLVAFADGGFVPEEHAALHAVARGLGLDARHARGLFHQAREQHLRSGGPDARRNGSARGSGGWRRPGRDRGRMAAVPATQRGRALAVLGLAGEASAEDVRRRHRELVKKFHPDAHGRLGPVAAQEATNRFRQIQRAYEYLSNSSN